MKALHFAAPVAGAKSRNSTLHDALHCSRHEWLVSDI